MFVLDWTDVEQMVAQEWIRRDSQSTCLGRWCRCCPYTYYKRTRIMTFYVLCVSLGFFMILFLSVMGDGLVKPYVASLRYHNTTCTVISPVLPSGVGCRCGTRCRSPFPCQGVYVTYDNDAGINVTGLLRRYETTEKCYHDELCYDNHPFVDWRQRLDFRPGEVLDCLYDPEHPTTIIHRRNASCSMVFHLLFWPCALLLGCLLAVATLARVCGCRYVFVRRPPEEVKREADRRDPYRHLVANMYYNNTGFANMNYEPEPCDMISLKAAMDEGGPDEQFTP